MRIRRVIFISLSFLFSGGLMAALSPTCDAAALKTLSGRVNRTDIHQEALVVDFTHPATGAVQAVQFRVTQETGLNGFRALSEMKPRDIVTVDYQEQQEGVFKAVYVAKFRVSGPPSGLEDFKGL